MKASKKRKYAGTTAVVNLMLCIGCTNVGGTYKRKQTGNEEHGTKEKSYQNVAAGIMEPFQEDIEECSH